MISILRNYIRVVALLLRRWFLVYCYGMKISPSARISWGARLDKTHPTAIYIGDQSYCASGCVVMSHDYSRNLYAETYIGKCCFIGVNAIVMPGVTIGDCVIVGAGAVVTKNIPSGCIVAGNPAKVIREGIKTTRFGKIIEGQDHLESHSSFSILDKNDNLATS